MDFTWVAIALGDVSWIALAFLFGLIARHIGLPPLIGFLTAGFLLQAMGMSSGETLHKLSDLGVTLLLFSIGLKLNPRSLLRPEVWGVSLLHMSLVVVLFGLLFTLLAA